MKQKYYYKNKSGTRWYCLLEPKFADNADYVSVTQDEWEAHHAEFESKVIHK